MCVVKSVFTKITAISLIFTFSLQAMLVKDAMALAPWLASQSISKKIEMYDALCHRRVVYAKNADDIALLKSYNSNALLVSPGKYLLSEELKDNALDRVRALIHEDIEALMQILKGDEKFLSGSSDRYRYNGIKSVILEQTRIKNAYYTLLSKTNKTPAPSHELRLNDMIATAFELILTRNEGFLKESDMSKEEKNFLETIEPFITKNKHNYFISDFWNLSNRAKKIRSAIKNGQVFYPAAQSKEAIISNPTKKSRNEIPLESLSNWFKTGEGLKKGDNLSTSISLKEISMYLGGKSRIKGILTGENVPDEDKTNVIFIYENDINHGLVVNCYTKNSLKKETAPPPFISFNYDHAANKVRKINLAGADIVCAGYNLRPIRSLARPLRGTIMKNGHIVVQVPYTEKNSPDKTMVYSFTNKKEYIGAEVVMLVEDDENHGQVINSYLAEDYDNDNNNVCIPIKTHKYLAKYNKKRDIEIDLALLDILDAFKGRTLTRIERVFENTVITCKNNNIKINISFQNKQMAVTIPKKQMLENFSDQNAIILVKNDINQGQVINIYLKSEYNTSKNPQPCSTYKYFPNETKIVDNKPIKGVCRMIDLAIHDLKLYKEGNYEIKPLENRVAEFLVKDFKEKNYITVTSGTGNKNGLPLSFQLWTEAKNVLLPNKLGQKVYGRIRHHKDYGSYIELFKNDIILGEYYYVRELHDCVPIRMDRLAFTDYILGNKNIYGDDVTPVVYKHKSPISSQNRIVLHYRNRKCMLKKMRLQERSNPVFVPVKSKRYGYKIHVYPGARYKENDLSVSLTMVRNEYFKTLVPIDDAPLVKAEELIERGFLEHAKILLSAYLEKLPDNGEYLAKRLLNHVKKSLENAGSVPDQQALLNRDIQKEIAPYLRDLKKVTSPQEIISAYIERDRITFADTNTRKKKLSLSNIQALLLPAGKFLLNDQYNAKKKGSRTDIALLRSITFLDIHALLQVLQLSEPDYYDKLRTAVFFDENILTAYSKCMPENSDPLTIKPSFNDIISKTFELITMKKHHFIDPYWMSPEEQNFLYAAENFLANSETDLFLPEFLDFDARNKKLQQGLISPPNFRQVSQPIPLAEKEQQKPLYEKNKARIKRWVDRKGRLTEGNIVRMNISRENFDKLNSRFSTISLSSVLSKEDPSGIPVIFYADKDINHGMVLNCYLENKLSTFHEPSLITTFRYFPEAKRIYKIDLAALDIICIAYGIRPIKTLNREYRTTVPPCQYCQISFPTIKNSKYKTKLVKVEMDHPLDAYQVVIVKVENDINRGQLVNVYLESELLTSRNPRPLHSYNFSTSLLSINLAAHDIFDYADGIKEINPVPRRTYDMPIYYCPDKTFFKAYLNIGYKQKAFIISGSEVKKHFNIKGSKQTITCQIKKHPTYGTYLEFSKNSVVICTQYYLEDTGKCLTTDLAELSIIDYVLENKINGKQVIPKRYLCPKIIPKSGILTLYSGTKKIEIRRLTSLAGKTVDLIPVEDEQYGYKILVSPREESPNGKKDDPIEMVKNEYLKLLIPIDSVPVYKARELINKGLLHPAKIILKTFLKNNTDRQASTLYNNIKNSLSKHSSFHPTETLYMLNELFKSFNARESIGDHHVLSFYNKLTSESSEKAELMIKHFLDILSSTQDLTERIRLHTSIYLVISALSNKYPSLILSKKLSDFIYPENIAHLENLRSAGSLFADTMINRLYFHGPTELNQFDNVPEKQPLLFDKPSLAAGIGTDSTILLENKILIDHIRDWMENSIPGEKHNKSTITIPTESLMDLGTHGIRLFNLISSSETFPPNTKINLVFNKCTNYGPMINCTFADVSMSKKYGYLITSLKYIRPDTVSVVNVGALDIVNIHHGDSIHIQSPLSVSALVQTPGYIKINMSIFNKDKNDDVFFDLSFRPDLIGKEVMLEVEKQGHHGQFINIYLQEEDNISIKKDALIARYQLSPSLNHVSFFPEDLGTLDLYAIYKGLKVSERPRKFNINVSEIDTFGNGICRLRIYPNTRDEEQLTFQIPHEYIKDPSKINAVLYIKNHKDYGHYVELRVDNKIVQHYRYSKTMGKFMKVNFPRLKLIDYILNNTNKEHQAISPCKYEHNDIIEPTGTLTLSYMGRTCSLFDLEPLIGTKPVFIPVHDKKTGYKIFMHDIAKYKLDPERTPDIILKKSVLFGTLIPEKSFLSGNRKKSKTISDKTLSDKKAAFLIKARVFANKGHFSYALNILRGYFKNFSKDKKVKQLYNKLLLLESLELSESTADPFYFISSQEKEFFLNLHNFGQSITENNDFTVPEYFKNFLTRSSPELTDEFYIKLIENINFEILHEHQAFVNIGIFTLLLKLPDTYQTIGLLKKLAEFIDYPGKYNNVLLPVARKLFTTFRIKSIIKLLNQTNNTKLQRFLSPMVKFKNKADTTYGEKDTEKDDEGGDLLDDFDQFEKGSPAKAMSVIIRNFGFKVFPKTALYPLRIKNWATKETYSEGTVDLEVRILKKLGILIMIKPGFYKLTSVLKGITPEETNLNIGSIYNLELKIGRTKIPLDRYEIPNEDIPTVKAIVQMQLAHILHKKTLTERPINQDQYKINIWKGYAAPKQMSFLTEAQKLNKKGSFEIRFNDLETLVSSACASAQTKNRNIVTILPYDLLSDAQILKLSDSNAQIIYMNIDKDYLNAYDCIQLEGIIATGAAYLSGNNITFNKLYKLLSETENNITVTLEELKLTPSLAKDFIFTLTPITIKNYNELKLINDRMRHFLQAA